MTGVGWLDVTGAVVFTAVAVLSIAQLATRWDALEDRPGVGLHAGMAAGMAAMSLPGPGPFADSAWVIAFAATGAWAARALWRRFRAARAAEPASRSWVLTGAAAHHLLGSIVMVVAFGMGHGAHGVADPAAATPADGAAHTAAAHAAHEAAGGNGHAGHAGGHDAATAGLRLTPALDDAVRAAGTWPIVWPVAGVGFLAYGFWSVRGGEDAPACQHCAARKARAKQRRKRQPAPQRLATAALGPGPTRAAALAMAGGMAAMAFAL